jgi:hypothetical protein
MEEKEKEELIKAINEVRRELNLQPYPSEYLENKEIEELRGLLREYIKIAEEEKRKPKIKLGRRAIIISLIALISFISFFSFQYITKPKAVNPSKLPPLQPINSSQSSATLSSQINKPLISLQSSFKNQDGNYVLILKNEATENVTLNNVKIDENNVNWKIISGELPILPESMVYISLSKKCDGLNHKAKIETNLGSIELTLNAC